MVDEQKVLGSKQRFGLFSHPIDPDSVQPRGAKYKYEKPHNHSLNQVKCGIGKKTVLFDKPKFTSIDDPYEEPIKSVTRGRSSSPEFLPPFKSSGGKLDSSAKSFLGVSTRINFNKYAKTPTRITNYQDTSKRNALVPRRGALDKRMPYPYEIDEFERKEILTKMEKSRNASKILGKSCGDIAAKTVSQQSGLFNQLDGVQIL